MAATTPGICLCSPCGGKGASDEAPPSGCLGQGLKLEFEPGAIVGAHVHRQRLGDGTEAARLRRAIDPDLERPVGTFPFDVTDEEGELALWVVDHVRPCQVAFRQVRAVRPAQAGEYRRRQVLDAQAAVGVAGDEILRRLAS